MIGFVLSIASQVSAKEAASNLASYFKLVGIEHVPATLMGVPLDLAALSSGLALMAGAAVWLFWPQKPAPVHAATPQPIVIDLRYPSAPAAPPPPAPWPSPADGKYVVGGRVEDEPGQTIGPMSIEDAVEYWKNDAPEFIPLDEAGRWLYDNAEPWLREHLQRPEPFNSITEHASALVGTAADDGVIELVARREAGLKHEPMKYSDLRLSAFDAMFDSDKRVPIDPMVRRVDLPKVLAHFKDPFTPPEPRHIKVKRDVRLAEALMFVVTGEWGQDPMKDGGGLLGSLGEATHEFRQRALDGDISVWGQTSPNNVWVPIDPDYWLSHQVAFLDVLKAETRTSKLNHVSGEPLYSDLMVSRAEFETQWRQG